MAYKDLKAFLNGKSPYAIELFDHFASEYRRIGDVAFIPAKTMIGIATKRKRVGYVTRIGKDFVHIVFHFDRPYPDNLCFQKIAQVPGQEQYNHHFRMLSRDDLNPEVKRFMRLAYDLGS